jgi:hypothetical protein
MAAIYSNGGNRWNILGFNFTKRDALSSLYKISMDITLATIAANIAKLMHIDKIKFITPSPQFNVVNNAETTFDILP